MRYDVVDNWDKHSLNLNQVHLVGKVGEEFTMSHEFMGKTYLKTKIQVPRTSGKVDSLPIIFFQDDVKELIGKTNVGKNIEVKGRFCSFRSSNGEEPQIERYVFASYLDVQENADGLASGIGTNEIAFVGRIKYEPSYRETPLGRIISDFYVQNYRRNGKPDRIPCIAWGKMAGEVASLEQGSCIIATGRIQSREYNKNTSYGPVTKTAYEVSVNRLEEFRLEELSQKQEWESD